MQYHKIETLFERDETTHKVRPFVFKNRTYTLLKEWHWTEKIDGTNIRCIWKDGRVSFSGKSDNAQIHADLVKWLYENITEEKMRSVFLDSPGVVYGEGYGAGIQKGGDYSQTKKLIVFDVLVDNQWWLNWENTWDVATKLGLDVVPYYGAMTLEQAVEMVSAGFKSKIGTAAAEGLVGRPEETLYDKKMARLITKIKTKDF